MRGIRLALLAGVCVTASALSQQADAQETAQRFYVSNEDSGTVSVIDVAQAKLVGTIEAGVRPRGIRLSPDGKLLYVALSGSPKCPPAMSDDECEKMVADKAKDGIAMIDIAQQKLVDKLPGGSDPEQFDITPDGKTIIVSNEDVGKASIVDIASRKVVKEIAVGGEPEGVKISPDGKLVLVTSEEDDQVTAITTDTHASTCQLKVGKRPRDIVFAAPTRAFVSSEIAGSVAEIDPVACKLQRTFKLPDGSRPMGMAVAPDGKTLYVANGRGRTVSAVDLGSAAIRTSEPVGTRPWGLAVSADGTRLFTANGPSNDVSVLDAMTLKVQSKIAAGKSPWGIAVSR